MNKSNFTQTEIFLIVSGLVGILGATYLAFFVENPFEGVAFIMLLIFSTLVAIGTIGSSIILFTEWLPEIGMRQVLLFGILIVLWNILLLILRRLLF